MLTVCLDTSFLMSAFDRNGPGHENAVDYLRLWRETPDVCLIVPTIVIAEYTIKDTLDFNALGYMCRVCAFGEHEAYLTAKLMKRWMESGKTPPVANNPRGRVGVKDDFKILSIALAQHADILATEDKHTMIGYLDYCSGLTESTPPSPLLTTDPFSKAAALAEVQEELSF